MQRTEELRPVLPVAPAPGAPKRKHTGLKIVVGLALIGTIGAGMGSAIGGTEGTPAAAQAPVEVPEEGNVGDGDLSYEPTTQEKMAAWWTDNRREWMGMSRSLIAVDLDGAVELMNAMDPMPVPEADRIFVKFNAEMNAAKLALDSGDLVGATHHVTRGNKYMDQITAYVERLA